MVILVYQYRIVFSTIPHSYAHRHCRSTSLECLCVTTYVCSSWPMYLSSSSVLYSFTRCLEEECVHHKMGHISSGSIHCQKYCTIWAFTYRERECCHCQLCQCQRAEIPDALYLGVVQSSLTVSLHLTFILSLELATMGKTSSVKIS